MERRVAVRAIIIKDDKILCVKLRPYSGAIAGKFWCTIGGGLDPGESLISGLKREVIEEVGIEPEIGNLLYVQQFKDTKREHLEFFFYIKNTEDYLNIDLSKTTHGLEEIAEIGFIDPKKEYVLPKFLSKVDLNAPESQTTQVFDFN